MVVTLVVVLSSRRELNDGRRARDALPLQTVGIVVIKSDSQKTRGTDSLIWKSQITMRIATKPTKEATTCQTEDIVPPFK
jgi:hypothetical protein